MSFGIDQLKRIELPIILGSFLCIVILFSFFIDAPEIGLQAATNTISIYATIVAAFATTVGIISLLTYHGKCIQRKQKDIWPFSLFTIIIFLITLGYGLVLSPIGTHPTYKWILDGIMNSAGKSAYSLTGFFIISAAYRAFRVRNRDAAILLITGCLVLLQNAPAAAAIWPGFEFIGSWIMTYINTAGFRAIFIGAGLASIATGLYIIIGYERGYLGGGK